MMEKKEKGNEKDPRPRFEPRISRLFWTMVLVGFFFGMEIFEFLFLVVPTRSATFLKIFGGIKEGRKKK